MDDLIACGIAGMDYEYFLAFTEARCEEIMVAARQTMGLPADYPWFPDH